MAGQTGRRTGQTRHPHRESVRSEQIQSSGGPAEREQQPRTMSFRFIAVVILAGSVLGGSLGSGMVIGSAMWGGYSGGLAALGLLYQDFFSYGAVGILAGAFLS